LKGVWLVSPSEEAFRYKCDCIEGRASVIPFPPQSSYISIKPVLRNSSCKLTDTQAITL